MTLISDATMELFGQYQARASQQIADGKRPALLACEADGVPCSHKFADIVKSDGLIPAVANLLSRCPRGETHVPKALIYSIGLVALPPAFSGYQPGNDPCKSDCDGPLGCGV